MVDRKVVEIYINDESASVQVKATEYYRKLSMASKKIVSREMKEIGERLFSIGEVQEG